MSEAAPHVVGLAMVCIDSRDPPTLAGFWASLLGGQLSVDGDGDARVTAGSGAPLDFLRVPEVKTLKNRLHLDVSVTDLALATAEALALGASLADDVYDGGRWQVLRDPEGNEFCLLPPDVS